MKIPALPALPAVVLLSLASFATNIVANWCPFCDAPSLTMAEQVGQVNHLLLGQWIGGEKPTNDSAGTAKFKIVEIGKSQGDIFKLNEELELPQYIAGKQDALYILMGPDIKLVDWSVPNEATKSSWKYVSELPMPATEEAAKIERLAYFLDFLQHPELTVANDAYAEFASAPYEVIKPLSDRMPREKLRQWVVDTETPVTRIGLYGLLLGLCGQEEDAEAMKQKILLPDSDFRLGIEGVMSGYLIIAGEKGLEVLEKNKMLSTTYVNKDGEEVKLPFSEVYATMQTLRFMWTYEPDRISKDRLKQSLRMLLDRPELSDLVIADLARWKDWGVQDRLMEMYDKEEFDIPSIKRAIVRYFFYCNKDVEEGASDVPAYALEAAEHLKTLEEKDPKTFANAKRFLR